MTKLFWVMMLLTGMVQVQAQAIRPVAGDAAPPPGAVANSAVANKESSLPATADKVGLVRGVVKRLDPVHDQMLIHAFGGHDVRIAFDPRTQLLSGDTRASLTSIAAGSIVSVDTVIDNGKLFARSVRTSESNAVELSGQVVRYDAGKSSLIVHDPISPESISLRVTPGTTVSRRGKTASPEALSAGMLVRVWYSPEQHAASNVEVLAEPGNSFIFEGRVVAVDLRSRVVDLSVDSEQSIRQLSVGTLDAASLGLLREGADVSIQAEFDGDRYKIRSVTAVPH